MSSRIAKSTGLRMVCTNVEVNEEGHGLLVLRAKRLGMAGKGNKTGVSKLLKVEIDKVIEEERIIQHPPTFHDDDNKACVLVPANPPVKEIDEVAVANA